MSFHASYLWEIFVTSITFFNMFDNVLRFKTLYRKNASQHFAQQPLLDFGNDDDPFETKINNNATTGGHLLGNDQPLFDQIIDLSNEENQNSTTISKTNHILNPTDDTSGGMEENSVIGAPIIAFEDSITASTKSDVPSTAGMCDYLSSFKYSS